MSKVTEKYIFSGFGFDILLTNVIVREKHGEEYPDINMNELKLLTAKALIRSVERIKGVHLKFLRTFLKISFDALGDKIAVPASTLRSWESKANETTGFSVEQEKAFRIFVINRILDSERNKFDRDLVLAAFSESKSKPKPLDLTAHLDYSYVANG